jgi:hypothetical protein
VNYSITEASSGSIRSIIIAFSYPRMSFLLSGRGSRVSPRAPVGVPRWGFPKSVPPRHLLVLEIRDTNVCFGPVFLHELVGVGELC